MPEVSKNSRKVWIILDHPWQMLLALAIRLNSPDTLRYGLIISRHKYWKKMSIEAYKPYFEEIFFFPEPERANSLGGLARFLKDALNLKTALRGLPIKPQDALLTLSYYKYMENILTTLFKNNFQIFLCRDDIYQSIHVTPRTLSAEFHVTKSGYLHYLLLEPLLGLKKRTVFYWINSPEQTHDTGYSKPVEKLYDKVLVFKSLFNSQPLKNNELYDPSLSLRKLTRQTGQKRIAYFLSGHIRNPNYYDKVNHLLEILRLRYEKDFLLEIRIHPNFPDELEKINAVGWQINREIGNAEEYLIRHASDIALVVSHLSTALVFASRLNIPSYTYYRCFGFDRYFNDVYDRIYADMPKEFFMTSFEQLPQKYEMPIKEQQVRQSLDKLYNALA